MLSTTKLGGNKLSHEVFFWQGKESTQVIILPIHGPQDHLTSVTFLVRVGLRKGSLLACSLLYTKCVIELAQDKRMIPEHMLALQDETGASAILAEQLDASMGGRPQEHRELQGQESPAFQAVRLTAWPSSEALGHSYIMYVSDIAMPCEVFPVRPQRNLLRWHRSAPVSQPVINISCTQTKGTFSISSASAMC